MKKIGYILALCLFQIACSPKPPEVSDSPSISNPKKDPLTIYSNGFATWKQESTACVPNAANSINNLEGTWKIPCYKTHSTAWSSDEIVVVNSHFTETVKRFSGASCDNSSLEVTIVTTGTFDNVGSNQLNYNGVNIINIITDKIFITPGSTDESSMLNYTYFSQSCGNVNGFCGINNWAVGVATDVTGKFSCASACAFPGTGANVRQGFALGNRDSGDLKCTDAPKNGLIFGANQSMYNAYLPHGIVMNAIGVSAEPIPGVGIYEAQ